VFHPLLVAPPIARDITDPRRSRRAASVIVHNRVPGLSTITVMLEVWAGAEVDVAGIQRSYSSAWPPQEQKAPPEARPS